MKKFKIPCVFEGSISPVTFYIGNPEKEHHPIQFQADWLSKERRGTVPPDIMQSLEELKVLSEKMVYLLKNCVLMLWNPYRPANP